MLHGKRSPVRKGDGVENRIACGRALRDWAVSAVHSASIGIAETAPESRFCSPHRASCFRPCSGMGQSHRNSGMTPSLSHLSNSCPRILLLAPGAPFCPCLPSPSRHSLLPVAALQEQQLCVMIP
ncbi:unnamed protein product, partial [Closterium sp. NIES-65]